jgi:hypothetical protein
MIVFSVGKRLPKGFKEGVVGLYIFKKKKEKRVFLFLIYKHAFIRLGSNQLRLGLLRLEIEKP